MNRTRAALIAVAVALGLVVTGVVGTNTASAAACTAGGSTHCYTTAVVGSGEYSPQATRLNATMRWRCMSPASVGAWMTHSLWGGTSDGGTVETGFITAPSGAHPRYPVSYWVRYGGSYGSGLQLYYTTFYPSRNTDYALSTRKNASNSYTFYRGSTVIGTLSSPNGSLQSAQAGFELAESNNDNNSGRVHTLQRVQNGVTYSGLNGSVGQVLHAPPYRNPPWEFSTQVVDTQTVGQYVVPCA